MGVFKIHNVATIGLLALFIGCRNSEKPTGEVVKLVAPLGLPSVPIPADNPPTREKIALGRKLFYDTQLSRDNTLSCASCHNPKLGFTDGRQFSNGVGGMIGIRNAPTLLNAVYSPFQFWDGRSSSLEAQVAFPIADPNEMNQTHEVSVSKIRNDPTYKAEFAEAFGPGTITLRKIEKSLASFERTLLSGNSRFDQYQFCGNRKALSAAAIKGFAIFTDPKRGNCVTCHTVNEKFALFTDGKFHNTGVGVDGEGKFTDLGRYNQTKLESDKGAFKTPDLRNVAVSAPYMHDGSLKTLKDVVDFYVGGGNSNPYLDKEMKAISLSAQDRADLVEFLKSLTGEMPNDVGSLLRSKVNSDMRHLYFLNLSLAVTLLAGCSGKDRTQQPATRKNETPRSYFKVDPATTGVVTGTIRYKGKKPTLKLINMSEEPACVEAHHGKAYDESLVVNRKGELMNAFVYIQSGLEGKIFEVPVTPVMIDQSGCWFRPRVMGIQTGQQLKVINSDPVTHNIHPMAQINREWNHSQGAGDPPLMRKFTKPEIMVPVKCNIHSWMHAFIGVLDHPYFAVSQENGSFEIRNLPPGQYTIAVWQEKLGTQVQPLTISSLGKAEINFTFEGNDR